MLLLWFVRWGMVLILIRQPFVDYEFAVVLCEAGKAQSVIAVFLG